MAVGLAFTTAFGLALLQALTSLDTQPTDANSLVSPLSGAAALTLALNAAGGRVARETCRRRAGCRSLAGTLAGARRVPQRVSAGRPGQSCRRHCPSPPPQPDPVASPGLPSSTQAELLRALTQNATVLGTGAAQEAAVNAEQASLLASLPSAGGGGGDRETVLLANSLWSKPGVALKQAYVDAMARTFKARRGRRARRAAGAGARGWLSRTARPPLFACQRERLAG
jgi:hypothetical protein